MSEQRPVAERWVINARMKGKKTVKIDMFEAKLWRSHSRVDTPLFWPKIPYRNEARESYFNTRFRVRLNGKWYSENNARFTMLTREQIINRFLREQ